MVLGKIVRCNLCQPLSGDIGEKSFYSCQMVTNFVKQSLESTHLCSKVLWSRPCGMSVRNLVWESRGPIVDLMHLCGQVISASGFGIQEPRSRTC